HRVDEIVCAHGLISGCRESEIEACRKPSLIENSLAEAAPQPVCELGHQNVPGLVSKTGFPVNRRRRHGNPAFLRGGGWRNACFSASPKGECRKLPRLAAADQAKSIGQQSLHHHSLFIPGGWNRGVGDDVVKLSKKPVWLALNLRG